MPDGGLGLSGDPRSASPLIWRDRQVALDAHDWPGTGSPQLSAGSDDVRSSHGKASPTSPSALSWSSWVERLTLLSAALLRSGFIWLVAGNCLYAGAAALMLVTLVRLGGPGPLGDFALAIAIVSPLVMFLRLQLREAYVADSADVYDFHEYQSVRIVLLCAGLVPAYLSVLAISESAQVCLVVVVMYLSKAVEGVSDMRFGVLQKARLVKPIGASLILRAVLVGVVFCLVLALSGGLAAALVGSLVVNLALLVAVDIPNSCRVLVSRPVRQGAYRRFRRAVCLAGTTLPLGLGALVSNLTVQVPRYFVEWTCGREALGVFSALSYVIIVAILLFDAVAQTLLGRFAVLYANGDLRRIRGLIGHVALGTAIMGVAGVAATALIGTDALRLVYGEAFAAHAAVLTLLALALPIGLFSWLAQCVLTALKCFRQQALAQCAGLAAVALFSYLLIPSYGLMGAALAVIVSFLAPLGLAAVFLQQKLKCD